MKMSKLEKRIVNSDRHGRRVATATLERLRAVPAQRGQRLLEVGCGTGVAARAAAETLGLNVTGVDVDADQIALARETASAETSVQWVVADATALPFEDRSFDIVLTNKTLHHIRDWRQALRECIRVLAPGGYLVVADIAPPAWAVRIVGRVIGGRPATVAELNGLAAGRGMHLVRQSRSLMTIGALWRRPE
jgi:ubiquinone/menaquinone biosynthesis C-methylase UbiE